MSESDEDVSFESAGDGDAADDDLVSKIEDLTVEGGEDVTTTVDAVDKTSTVSSEKLHFDTPCCIDDTSDAYGAGNPTSNTSSVGLSPASQSKPQQTDAKLTPEEGQQAGWGWGNLSSWGTSMLNTAATSVGTFTSHVGEGLHQVLETVETGFLGDNDEETTESSDPGKEMVTNQEMIRHSDEEGTVTAATVPETSLESKETGLESKDSWMSGWKLPVFTDVVNKTSSVVQQTVQQTSNVSKMVIGGGIDVLEAIGRKTYDVIAEGDHGLKKTLEKSRENKSTLSQTLREAKEMAESREEEEEEFNESRKSSFGAQFDEFQGLVQLEALESLNSTSEQKVRRFIEMLPKDSAELMKSDLKSIRFVFDAVQSDSDDDEATEQDFNQLVTDYFGRLNLNASVQKLLNCQSNIRTVCGDFESNLQQSGCTEKKTAKEIHQAAIQSLAEITACTIEHWHRVGQQVLLNSMSPQSLHDVSKELAAIVKVLCCEISLLSASFVDCLTLKSQDDAESTATDMITAVYLESSNASDYVRKGFLLLLPVLQLSIIKAHPLFKDSDD